MTDESKKEQDEVTDDQLDKAAGGAWQTVKERAIQDLEAVKDHAIQDLEAVKDGIRD